MSLENKMMELFASAQPKKTKINRTLILDFSNIAWSTFFTSHNSADKIEDKIQLWKYYMLNSIRAINAKFNPQEFIIAVDSGSWRKDKFTYYKAQRQIARKKSSIDMTEVYSGMADLVDLLIEYFPYRVVKTQDAEADDIIAVISSELKSERAEIIIVSEDKDFQQLLEPPIKLYSNAKKKFIKCGIDINEYRIRHILGGDSSDGIPNILSDDDVFINSEKRQKHCGPVKINKILEEGLQNWIKENNMTDNWNRNRTLVELSKQIIPKSVWEDIILSYKRSIEITQLSSIRKINEAICKLKIKNFSNKIGDFTI